MLTVEIARRIAAPADRVWQFTGDFAGNILTKGYVARVETRGQGIGALRTYHLDPAIGGGAVVERLIEHDHAERVIAYDMVDYGPLPWADYGGRIKVTPAGPDACIFIIRTQFFPLDPERGEELRGLSQGNIEMYIANLEAAVRA
ncbi:SRPBCC family protein [Sphingobium sp. WCS2017Hpa-17]|uniref:SRPBCC family protein n=1 Tax=Sphingobium sp. WCS2017Hpa-17 TaxID=3073638 RepID=UPI00288A4C00|nr:SRPBCC family protein [Sphingobium sp. WCS2017Hpa-17]